MKKYIVIVLLVIAIIGVVYYINKTKTKTEDNSAGMLIIKAEEYIDDKQYSKALEQYKLAINADPSITQSYIEAANIYLLKSKKDEALSILKSGENNTTNPDQTHYLIGKIYYENYDMQNALEYFEKANNENPNNFENAIYLIKTFSYYPDKKEQMKKVIENIKSDDQEVKNWINYYLALLSYEDINKSISYLEESSNIEDSEIKNKINDFLKSAKKIQTDPEDIVQNNTLLVYELIRGELYPLAIPLLEKVISENDEYYAAFMYLGICYINMNNLDKAKENLQSSVTVDPNQIQPKIFLAQVYTKQNNQKDAIDIYEEILNTDKTNETARYDYAKTLVKFNLLSQAKQQYLELINLVTDKKIEYEIELVEIYLDNSNESVEGLNLSKSIIDDWNASEHNTELKAKALDLLGWSYQKNSQKDEALNYISQSQELYSYLPASYYHLGVIYREIGNQIEATVNLERAIDLDLEGSISSKAIAELEKLQNESKSTN